MTVHRKWCIRLLAKKINARSHCASDSVTLHLGCFIFFRNKSSHLCWSSVSIRRHIQLMVTETLNNSGLTRWRVFFFFFPLEVGSPRLRQHFHDKTNVTLNCCSSCNHICILGWKEVSTNCLLPFYWEVVLRYFHFYLTGRNLVTWPSIPVRKSGRCNCLDKYNATSNNEPIGVLLPRKNQ